MAFRLITAGVPVFGVTVSSIANVDLAVGPRAMGGANLISDTQLVQFLLNFIMTESSDVVIKDRNGQKMRSLPVDGIFTARTFDAIKGFQNFVRDIRDEDGDRAPILADGVVNSSNGVGVSTISGTIYTIVWLNALRQDMTGEPLDEDQVSIEPLHSALADVRRADGFEPAPSPNPLPPPPPPPIVVR